MRKGRKKREIKETQGFSAIGQIIDATPEEVTEGLKDLPYGQLCNVKKFLEGEYQRVETTKNALANRVTSEDAPDEEKAKAKLLIEQLYIALQRIEDRCTIVETLKAEKSVKH